MNSNLSEKIENKGTACPHIGTEDDPATYLEYPSQQNICYKSMIKAVPLSYHQENFCLTKNHVECPVFQKNRQTTFPVELRFQEKRSRKPKPWIWFLALLVLIGAFVFFPIIPGLFNPTQVGATEIPSIQTMVSNFSIPITETALAQVEQPTFTPLPSVSPILETVTPSNPPHTMDTPIGVTHRFVIHRMQEGESLGNLAVHYDTNLQSIREVNYFLPEPVWINWLVIIPVEATDVVGLPKFEAQMVVNGDVTIEVFAANQKLDPSTLKFYNGFPDGYLLSSGEWLLIPHIIE